MKLEIFLLDADYIEKEGNVLLRLFGKTEQGKNVVVFFEYEPYFYVLPQNLERAEREIKDILERTGKEKVRRIDKVKKELELQEREFLKVVCNLPSDTQKVRDVVKQLEEKRGGTGSVIEEYEYAINFYRRFLLDKKISGSCWVEVEGDPVKSDLKVDFSLTGKGIKPVEKLDLPQLKVLSFDIETYEEGGRKEIIMLSLWGNDKFSRVLTYRKGNFQSYVEVVDDEKKLLERFVEIIDDQNPDILVSFNGDAFDFPVIQERASQKKVKLTLSRDKKEMKFTRRARASSARIKGRVHIDLFNFINNILSPNLQTEVLTLDAVSSELLGDKKIEMDYQDLLEVWREKKDLSKLAEYCLKDSELTFKLANLLLPQILEISRIVGQLPFDSSRMTYGQLAEWYLTRKAVEVGRIIPNQPKWEDIKIRRSYTYTGGFVKEPLAGLHENIAVLDFRSLYPSVIATFNISPETLNCSCCKEDGYKVPGTGYWFCKKRKGFVSQVIKQLINDRAKIKEKMKHVEKDTLAYRILDNRQLALKIVANATYGMFAFAGAKWYCRECAESCAAFGRYYTIQTIKKAEEKGFTVVYADTDSCFINLPERENLGEKTKEFLNYINEELPGILELELQGVYKRGIFIPRGAAPGTAKKRYALIDEQDNLVIRGLETVRRDWCNLAKDVQRQVLIYVLKEKNVDKAIQYVRKIVKMLKEEKIPLKELIIYEQLTKPLFKYKQIGPHVVAARKMLQRGREVGEGMLVMFAIIKGKGSISERAEPIEDVTRGDIDEGYYIENQIIPAALRVLQVLNVDKRKLLNNTRPEDSPQIQGKFWN